MAFYAQKPSYKSNNSVRLWKHQVHQIRDLIDISRYIASIEENNDRALEYLITCLEDLQDIVQCRKVDALIVETLGRRIEKLLWEKYLHLCELIEDEKTDSSSYMVDEDGGSEDDVVRSLRTSPKHLNCKDRTSIEDFEIIKPISRGAFGPVFLARKRLTGDLFVIKVKRHVFFKDINWDTLARQKAAFVPAAEGGALDTSYFTCRYNWHPSDHVRAETNDFDNLTDTCSNSSSRSNLRDEEGDECCQLADFGGTTLSVKYSFSNFSFKNLSQLAAINYDLTKGAKDPAETSNASIP